MAKGFLSRLAGQKTLYVVNNLKRFRANGEARKHVGMSSITADLADADIAAISLYLANLQ
jgi:cytochrome c553